MTIEQILDAVDSYKTNLVELTGGEPLVQGKSHELIAALAERGYKVLLETSGSLPIKDIDKRAVIIMDLKCPTSGMVHKNLYENITFLKQSDEVKFVMGSREDYEWTKKIINEYQLTNKVSVLFSCIFGSLEPVQLVNWMLEDNITARFQLQLHKFIWQPEQRGV